MRLVSSSLAVRSATAPSNRLFACRIEWVRHWCVKNSEAETRAMSTARNQLVSHQGGVTWIGINVPVSFQTPSSFDPVTRNTYFPGSRFV
jgi:hypothetical protein